MTKRRARKSSKKPGLLERSGRLTRIGILVVIIVFCAAGLNLVKSAPNPSVRFVLFCSTDECSGSKAKVNTLAHQVRGWYKKQLGGGKTFRMLKTKKVVGDHSASWYRSGPNGYDIQNIWEKIQDEGKLEETNVKVVAVLGFSADRCGIGGPPYLGVVAPLSGRCNGYMNSAYAHELAHTWDLARTGDGHRTDGSLMHQPAACNANTLGRCKLNSTDRSFLLNNRKDWFPSSQASTSSFEFFQPADDDESEW